MDTWYPGVMHHQTRDICRGTRPGEHHNNATQGIAGELNITYVQSF